MRRSFEWLIIVVTWRAQGAIRPTAFSHRSASALQRGSRVQTASVQMAISLPPAIEWLQRAGYTGSDVSQMLSRCPKLVRQTNTSELELSVSFLRDELNLRSYDMRKVTREAPELLMAASNMADTLSALQSLGLQPKHLRAAVVRWPPLLTVRPEQVIQVSEFLANEADFPRLAIASLYRHAPWVLEHDAALRYRPAVQFLQSLGVNRTQELNSRSVQYVVRAFPRVLLADPANDLMPRVLFLTNEVGIDMDDLPKVIEAFPLIFGISLEQQMVPALEYLRGLGIADADITKICRAFPSLLGLEVDRHFEPSINFLNEIGIQNVARFVTRIPPVLGYDVENDLRPKMRFLTDELMLSVYDVVRFPAYFSYPLDKIIQSRVAFLKERGLSVSIWGLSTVLTLSDAEFATELAQVSPEVYGSFKKAFASRAKQQRGTMKASATVAKSDTKAATIDAEPQTRGLLSDADLMGPRSDEPADEPTWFGLPPSNSPQSKPRRGSIGSFFKGRFSPAKLFPLD